MAEEQLQQFLAKVAALNAFVALSEADPALRERLRDCSTHHEVVALARRHGFEIGRRWGDPEPPPLPEGALGDASLVPAALVESALVESASVDAAQAEAAQVGAAQVEAAQVESAQAESAQAESAQAEARGVAGNLLAGSCPPEGQELTTVLLERPGLRLERIHSCLAASPEGFWYDQPEHEWVLLLQGSARLQFADEARPRDLCRGDALLIEAGRRHRVVATDGPPGSVWLALFWPAASAS